MEVLDAKKKVRGKNWKSYCGNDCFQCHSIFFVKSANRYCYEDKFDLPQVPKKILYKKNKQVNLLEIIKYYPDELFNRINFHSIFSQEYSLI